MDERLMAEFAAMEVLFADDVTLIKRGEMLDLFFWRQNLIGFGADRAPVYERTAVIRVVRPWRSLVCKARSCPLAAEAMTFTEQCSSGINLPH
jgi:hypothetical protein